MRILQDALLGPECRSWFEEGEVDDTLLIILFLTLEGPRKKFSWKSYLDMLPRTFGNPLWFTDEDFLELKGTTLYRATELQKKSLQSLYDNKVEGLVKKLLTLDGDLESAVPFEDFLWANSIFWTRALNIPLPHSYVFPQTQVEDNNFSISKDSEHSIEHFASGELDSGKDEKGSRFQDVNGGISASTPGETIWVEGLVPGIDSAEPSHFGIEREISINYGNKGNEELLYLYEFVIDDNLDDYLMVHYPMEAIQSVPFSQLKSQLFEAQKAELKCLLPRSLLDQGYSLESTTRSEGNDSCENRVCNYSWSGRHKMPSYLNKLVFPENFLTAWRTIALKEELFQVSSKLEELAGSMKERQPFDTEVCSAVWEACGDSGALQMLVD
ncbi:[Fructose-bisphosphate aldolase]-lysine N-methyltransferase, chloroplastic [Morella rubra]|uniref:[Fructose-bisphosphate aldolase]-lysine N-methyltransferase, chloroplastic n=1 Tax=Morella rubra TaxID=262757 RepID=A0A6A1W0B0_9ROSI|nr:[Fructose-bisphosphate aldolase]-lysine N-methyltransferase, chloroplastic [Morella rubra]